MRQAMTVTAIPRGKLNFPMAASAPTLKSNGSAGIGSPICSTSTAANTSGLGVGPFGRQVGFLADAVVGGAAPLGPVVSGYRSGEEQGNGEGGEEAFHGRITSRTAAVSETRAERWNTCAERGQFYLL